MSPPRQIDAATTTAVSGDSLNRPPNLGNSPLLAGTIFLARRLCPQEHANQLAEISMNPQLTLLLAEEHVADLRGAAERARIASGAIHRAPKSRPRNPVARLSALLQRVTSRPTATGHPGSRPHVDRDRPVTIRRSTSADLALIREIAQLDSQGPPRGPSLVAEIDDEIVAAIVIGPGTVIANPFRRTADAVALLRLRTEQLRSPQAPSRRALGRLRARNAAAEA
jgi:hypothetical protein